MWFSLICQTKLNHIMTALLLLSIPPQLLCLVGEAFDDYSDDVCGAVVNVRNKGDKIAVWTANYENREAVTHIGWVWGPFSLNFWGSFLTLLMFVHFLLRRVYKERLGLPSKMTIGYQSHADTATKSGSTTKNKFVVWDVLFVPLFIFLSYLLLAHTFPLLQSWLDAIWRIKKVED